MSEENAKCAWCHTFTQHPAEKELADLRAKVKTYKDWVCKFEETAHIVDGIINPIGICKDKFNVLFGGKE